MQKLIKDTKQFLNGWMGTWKTQYLIIRSFDFLPARRAILFLFMLILFISVLSIPVRAGTIQGKLKSSQEFLEYYQKYYEDLDNEEGNSYWNLENAVLPIQPVKIDWPGDIVVSIFKKEGGASFDKIQKVSIKGAMFLPSTIVVPPKTTVKFKNEDSFVHSLYSADLGTTFEPEILPTNQVRQIQFINPGTYIVKCKMTPHLEGIVIVEPDAGEMAIPSEDGSFNYQNVAPGEYELKVFFRGKLVGSSKIVISDEKPVAVEIELKSPLKSETEEESGKGKGEEQKANQESTGSNGEKKNEAVKDTSKRGKVIRGKK